MPFPQEFYAGFILAFSVHMCHVMLLVMAIACFEQYHLVCMEQNLYLRLLTALELSQHQECYDILSPNYTKTIADNKNKAIVAAYQELLKDATTPGNCCEMMHLYALSAAVGVPIQSYMPPLTADINPFTKTVFGCNVVVNNLPKLMWTMMTMPRRPIDYTDNHFAVMSLRLRRIGKDHPYLTFEN